jgi:hypothetical protein
MVDRPRACPQRLLDRMKTVQNLHPSSLRVLTEMAPRPRNTSISGRP